MDHWMAANLALNKLIISTYCTQATTCQNTQLFFQH